MGRKGPGRVLGHPDSARGVWSWGEGDGGKKLILDGKETDNPRQREGEDCAQQEDEDTKTPAGGAAGTGARAASCWGGTSHPHPCTLHPLGTTRSPAGSEPGKRKPRYTAEHNGEAFTVPLHLSAGKKGKWRETG